MAKQNKKQKRQQKIKKAKKAKATKQHQQNYQAKRAGNLFHRLWGPVGRNDPTAFCLPVNYWIACPNERIGCEEVKFLNERHSDTEIPAYIFPIYDEICKAMNNRLNFAEQDEMDFSGKHWMVVTIRDMLPLASFSELSEAKEYVFSEFTQVKTIRSESLGLLAGRPDFKDIPDHHNVDKEFWVSYFLDQENKHGFQFDPLDFVSALLEHIVFIYNAPDVIHIDFFERSLLEKAYDFIEMHGLHGYKLAIDVALEFEENISRIECMYEAPKLRGCLEMPFDGDIYVTNEGEKIYVESVWGEEGSDFYTVDFVLFSEKDDIDAISRSLNNSEWEELHRNLELQLLCDEPDDRIEELRMMFKK
ncbi:hypothetical protein MACH09_45930 [Vibrio sp. MACH09]|uniref:hypothetical protein n=1 Tax=Vibrio sp. MACH09 TaxID=3025122 RepID=UPI00278D2ECF|nr:hypothetical protein [Vibrio sp. MACH09]GLO64085.1 hypothetical protein MACH09_45930 [Vibrio sp. MACH09]